LELAQLQHLLETHQIDADTPACCHGDPAWTTVRHIHARMCTPGENGHVSTVPFEIVSSSAVANGRRSSLINAIEKATEREPQKKSSIGRYILIILVILLLLGGAGFFFRDDLRDLWVGYTSHSTAAHALQVGNWDDGLKFSHAAFVACPSFTSYQQLWLQAEDSWFSSLMNKQMSMKPLEYLAFCHQESDANQDYLQEKEKQKVIAWLARLEAPALQQIHDSFETTIEEQDKLLTPFATTISSYLLNEANAKNGQEMMAAWSAISQASKLWANKKFADAATLAATVPSSLQMATFHKLDDAIEALRAKLLDQVSQANLVAQNQDFFKAKDLLGSLKEHESWVKEISVARIRLDRLADTTFTAKLVAAATAKNVDDAANWLAQMLQFHDQPADKTKLVAVFSEKSFKSFITDLQQLGLSPVGSAKRTGYADVRLVATNLENFDDADAAKSFLATQYLAWAQEEYTKKNVSVSCYLALLATKYGATDAAKDLTQKSLQELDQDFACTVTVSNLSAPPSLSKDLNDEISSEVVSQIKPVLPSWVKLSVARDQAAPAVGATAAAPAPTKFNLVYEEVIPSFEPAYTKDVRNPTKNFRFPDRVEPNPKLEGAQDDLQTAQNNLANARQTLNNANANLANAQSAATPISNTSGTMLGAILSGVANGVESAVVANARNDVANAQGQVDSAQAEVESAQSRLQNMPRTINVPNWKEVTWKEIDNVTVYDLSLNLGFKVGDQEADTQTLDSTFTQKSVEVPGDSSIDVAPVPRQILSQDEVESTLLKDMKPKIDSYASSAFLRSLKTSLAVAVDHDPSAKVDLEYYQNLFLASELLWWDTPLRDMDALQKPELRARFGDVIAP
jgi:hypothetical protein